MYCSTVAVPPKMRLRGQCWSTAAPTSPGVGPTDETAPLWQPKFDQSDDLGGLLTAHSPLLSRAFKLEAGDDDAGQGDDAEEAADS